MLLRALTFAVDVPFSYWHRTELYSRSIEKAAKIIYSKAVASHAMPLLLSKLFTLQILVGHLPSTGPAVGNNSCATFSSTTNGLTPFFQTQRVTKAKITLWFSVRRMCWLHANEFCDFSQPSNIHSCRSIWLDLASGMAKHLITP